MRCNQSGRVVRSAAMSISKRPSKVTVPENIPSGTTVLAFLSERFPHISVIQWQKRMQASKVHWLNGPAIDEASPAIPGKIVCYYREVESEPEIPFRHKIIFQNEHIVIADKPHFLQVTPGGSFVNECLLARLQKQLQQEDIVPVHRLDRDTAGLVMFSLNPKSRADYFRLFQQQAISKGYQAVAKLKSEGLQSDLPIHWKVQNRIEAVGTSHLRQQFETSDPAQINARSCISLVAIKGPLGLFELHPQTGKTHQLRLHMLSLGMPILNDRFYPKLMPRAEAENYRKPLQLLAKSLRFTDPVSGEPTEFQSDQQLSSQTVSQLQA